MNNHRILEAHLLDAYEKLRVEIQPTWAVHKRNSDELVVPTIPFVGNQYAEQKLKILVYASAENLANYCVGEPTDRPWLDNDVEAQNRHRRCFDLSAESKDFFPNVHIQPMNDGTLSTAVYYLAQRLLQVEFDFPRDFYETIAFGNFGKFSIETEFQRNSRNGIHEGDIKNIDYTSKTLSFTERKDKLSASLLFLKADIKILKPDLIILPENLYTIVKEEFDEIRGDATLIPIYQMVANTFNRTFKNRKDIFPKSIEELSPAIRSWYEELHSVSKENYRCTFTYLDKRLREFGYETV